MAILRRFLSILRLIFCIINNAYALPVYLACYALLQPVKLFSERTFWAFEGWLFEKLLSMVAFWAQLSGHELFTSGDEISSVVDEECILMTNHQATGDIPVLMHAMRGKRPALCHVMWIMDWILQFLNFGWVAKGHGDFFLLQGSDIRKFKFLFKGSEDEIKINELQRFKKHLTDVYCSRDRKWMVLFPEGGFLHKRRAGSQRFSKRNNLPILEHVTVPRIGAFQAIVDVLGVEQAKNFNSKSNFKNKKIKFIIDVTIGYPKNEPLGFGGWVMGHEGPKQVFLHCRIFPAKDLLAVTGEGDSNTVSEKWIYDRFIEKEKLLENFYATGSFIGKENPTPVKCYTAETLFGHLFCLVPWFLLGYYFLF